MDIDKWVHTVHIKYIDIFSNENRKRKHYNGLCRNQSCIVVTSSFFSSIDEVVPYRGVELADALEIDKLELIDLAAQ